MAKSLQSFEAEQSALVQGYIAQLAEKDRIIEGIHKESGNLEVLFNNLLAHVSAIKPVPIIYNPKTESNSTEIETVIQHTDWHIGEIQEADEIEQINEFNYEIATSRVKDLVYRTNRIVDRSRLAYTIKKATILCTGDMITGDLRDEATRTNEFDVPVQVVKAAELFASAAIGYAQNFDQLVIEYITADNHSRLTRKPQSKNQGTNSFNYLVAIIVEKLLSRQNNIDFRIHIEPQKVVSILNMKYLLLHGHQIRGWAGIPWYGVERKVGKESTSRLSMIMDDPSKIEKLGFNKIVAGHLHTPINTWYYSVGGSLMGTTANDRENGRYSPPSQPIWNVDPKYGEFGRIDFRL